MFDWLTATQPEPLNGPALETRHFTLRLSRNWRRESSHNPEQYLFGRSDGSALTVIHTPWQMDEPKLDEAADRLLAARWQSIQRGLGQFSLEQVDVERRATDYPGIEVRGHGRSIKLEYFCRFYALITSHVLINILVESPRSDDAHNLHRFGQVMEGFSLQLRGGLPHLSR
ncbi:hypothetical protein [Parachitinimonas caeni]|uniref:DUF1795 domain-containing protein n=1 Tax=Parachitinimonas caeni TaxID=3031301 RepID=A0ABT7E698_9NEIS|nr:hypothetical protein [Parachitinimonas caeni]MDK2126878.1 hypothetical protein [Parachitinimonas caeni]